MNHDDHTAGSTPERTASSGRERGGLLLEWQARIALPRAVREGTVLPFLQQVV